MKNLFLVHLILTIIMSESCQDRLNIEPNYFSIPYYDASYEWNGKVYSGDNDNRKLLFKAIQKRAINNYKKDTFLIEYQHLSEGDILTIGIYNIPLVIGKHKINSLQYDSLGLLNINTIETIGSLSARDNDILLFSSDIDTTSTINYINVTKYDSVTTIIEGTFSADFKLKKVGSYIRADSFFRVRSGIFKAKLL